MIHKPTLEVAAAEVVVGEVVVWGSDVLDAGVGEGKPGAVAGGIGVVAGEDAAIAGQAGEIGEGWAAGSTAQGGDVAKVAAFLPGEHAVELAFDEEESSEADPEV